MRKNRILILFVVLFLSFGLFLSSSAYSSYSPRIGVWVTIFSPEEVFHSTENADRFIETCVYSGIDDVYLQIYRGNKAYYDSEITDKTPFDRIFLDTKQDIIKYLLEKAKKNNIRVHAWINLLSLAQNQDASILKEYGPGILAIDQYGRTSLPEKTKDELDKYYIRENQLFLEPGDARVRKYLAAVAEEIIKKYPDFSGLHLDYIRYPSVVPFVPGARFTSHGISYGYSETNAKNFKDATGIDIKTMAPTRENFQAWDSWRRHRVTLLLAEISAASRKIKPSIEISCAIVPSVDRTYLTTFQDWTKWLENKSADYVVAMNYTDDSRLMKLNTDAVLFGRFRKKVHMGLGAYLLKDKPEELENQITYLKEVMPEGIVFFSYDDIASSSRLQEFLRKNFL